MKRFALVLCLLSLPLFAEEPSPEPAPSTVPAGYVHRYFAAGFYLTGGLPGTFTPSPGGVDGSGMGLGYGFNVSFSPISYFSLQAMLDALFHSVDIPTTADNEFASVATLGLNAKIYPLGGSAPRLYGLVGIGLVNFWVHDHFTFTPSEGEGASFRGPRYNFGVGYEHPFTTTEMATASFYAEFVLAHTVLDRRTFSNAPSVDLSPSVSRWSPIVNVGLQVAF